MGFDISSQESSIGSVQRDYLYIFSVEQLPSGLGSAQNSWLDFAKNVDFFNQKAIWPDKKTAPIRFPWGGQYMYFSGVEQSTKEADFTFYDDEEGRVYSFFSSWQALTGDDEAHAAGPDPSQRGVVMISDVNTEKSIITKARVLTGFKAMGVSKSTPNKEGQGLSIVTVHAAWTKAYDNLEAAGKTVTTASTELQQFLSGSYALTEKPKSSGDIPQEG